MTVGEGRGESQRGGAEVRVTVKSSVIASKQTACCKGPPEIDD